MAWNAVFWPLAFDAVWGGVGGCQRLFQGRAAARPSLEVGDERLYFFSSRWVLTRFTYAEKLTVMFSVEVFVGELDSL